MKIASYVELIHEYGVVPVHDAVKDCMRSTRAFADAEIERAVEMLHTPPTTGGAPCILAEAASGSFAPAMLLGFAVHAPIPLADRVYEVQWLAVRPEAQRNGVARTLLAIAEANAEAQNARMVLIDTGSRAAYEKARRFYRRAGYYIVSRIPDFFSEGDDLVTFAKYLDGSTKPMI